MTNEQTHTCPDCGAQFFYNPAAHRCPDEWEKMAGTLVCEHLTWDEECRRKVMGEST